MLERIRSARPWLPHDDILVREPAPEGANPALLTPAIVTQCQINLNRNDSAIGGLSPAITITTQIQTWVNEIKRDLERMFDMDYMQNDATNTVSNATPYVAISTLCDAHYFKNVFGAQYRQLTPSEDLSWTPIERITLVERASIESYISAGTVYTGAPQGYYIDSTNVNVSPKPEDAAHGSNTYALRLFYYTFSTDWAFTSMEEPYLAMYAWQAIVAGATMLGFDWLGEDASAKKWEAKFMEKTSKFRNDEAARSLGSNFRLTPLGGAADVKVNRRLTAQMYPNMGLGRL